MNDNVNDGNRNHYEGNGWSKYQIMVLQQLEDHNRVLQNLNKEVVDIKQTMAVTASETKHWRDITVQALEALQEKMNFILHDESGINHRVGKIERILDVEEKTSIKLKATWAIYGAVVVFLVDMVFKLANVFFVK